ncbi:MAG: hypothetical protein EB072_07355 [Betaproteobacteria bacterium]|nr:hypothetical protein [Betaproteobacteria bacterium]
MNGFGGMRPTLTHAIDEHRHRYGVGPIYKVLQFAPSAYRRYAARQRDHSLISHLADHGVWARPSSFERSACRRYEEKVNAMSLCRMHKPSPPRKAHKDFKRVNLMTI